MGIIEALGYPTKCFSDEIEFVICFNNHVPISWDPRDPDTSPQLYINTLFF